MANDNHDNPVANGLIFIVLVGAAQQCVSQKWEAVEKQATTSVNGFFSDAGLVLGSYLIPFLGASLITGLIMTQICRIPLSEEDEIDLRLSVIGLSVIAAGVLWILGIPKIEATWMLSLWAGILFGGPLGFCFGVSRYMEASRRHLQEQARIPLDKKIEALKDNLLDRQTRIYDLSARIRELEEEVEKLQQRDKFLSKKEKDESGETSILDSDDTFWKGAD